MGLKVSTQSVVFQKMPELPERHRHLLNRLPKHYHQTELFSEMAQVQNPEKLPKQYLKGDLEALEHTELFESNLIKHIFNGEVKTASAGKGKTRLEATGYHTEVIRNAEGRIIPGTKSELNEKGVYQGRVTVNGIRKFTDMIDDLGSRLTADGYHLPQIIDDLLEATGYDDELRAQEPEKADDRINNILELKNKIAQYEQEEKDRLALFGNTSNRNVRQLYRPVRGAIMHAARPDLHEYGTTIRTAKNENVLAVARGTVVSAERRTDNTFTVVLQSGSYTAIYSHVAKVLKPQGSTVEAGDALAMMDGEHDLVFELWNAGQFVNFQEVIVW